ncbi:MAG: hypothetical protein HW390_3514 [Candidatus Brocadiaceae bacterium]|nr:hypothetical protein [Candidatus Brocadiaceae bacterium]
MKKRGKNMNPISLNRQEANKLLIARFGKEMLLLTQIKADS